MVPIITTLRCWMIIVCLLNTRVDLIAARSDPNNDLQHEVNICINPEQLRCPDGHVISVQEVRCGSRSPCVSSFNQSLTDVCHGHQTCSNIGLQDMFSSQCGNHHTSGVHCSFRCVPGQSASCRSNICDQDSQGLVCPSGSTLHIRRVTCSDGSPDCSWISYNLLTSFCEGSSHCAASGLRALLSPRCDINGQTKRQVMVEYLCVPAKFVHKTCSSFRYRPIVADFGIVRSPNPPKKYKNDLNKNKQCKWMIAFQKKQPVRVNVLLVQSRLTKTGCDPNFLRIQLVSCVEKKMLLRSFCNLEDSSVQFVSCGPIKITSSTSSQQDGNNQFIISFQGFSDGKDENFLSSGLPACAAPPPPIPRVLTLPTKSDISHNALHDSEPDDLKTENSGQSGSFKMTIKMLLLYIFLGVLILVLATALITIIVRYRRISLPKNKYADSTENVMLWRRYEDTAMDVFQQNGMAEHAGSYTSDRAPNADQVIATVHHDPVPDHELDHRTSCGSGISSFLPPKRDSGFKDLLDTFQLGSFANYNTANNVNSLNDRKSRSVSKHDYYELPEHCGNQDIYQALEGDDDLHFNSHYSNPNSLSRPPKVPPPFSEEVEHHLMATEDHQPLVTPEIYPKDDYHYCVNNDEYAVVNKSRKPHRVDNRHSGAKTHTMNGIDGSNTPVDFRPTSGPYDKSSYSASNSNRRKSREKTWKDDL